MYHGILQKKTQRLGKFIFKLKPLCICMRLFQYPLE